MTNFRSQIVYKNGSWVSGPAGDLARNWIFKHFCIFPTHANFRPFPPHINHIFPHGNCWHSKNTVLTFEKVNYFMLLIFCARQQHWRLRPGTPNHAQLPPFFVAKQSQFPFSHNGPPCSIIPTQQWRPSAVRLTLLKTLKRLPLQNSLLELLDPNKPKVSIPPKRHPLLLVPRQTPSQMANYDSHGLPTTNEWGQWLAYF